MNPISIFIILLFSIPSMLYSQDRNESDAQRFFSFGLTKSLYTTPDQGLSFGDAYVWIPDIEVGMYINKTRLALDYRHYNASYPIRYLEGDIETREFSLFDLTYYRLRLLNSSKIDVSLGAGMSLRLLNELVIAGLIMTSGGWYEIHSDRFRTISPGAILSADSRYDLTRQLFIEASVSYNAYLNSYNIGRLGICVGYYFGRK